MRNTKSASTFGFTLTEVLITSALAILVLSIAVEILIPSMKSAAATAGRVQLQQSAVNALNRIVLDLQRSLAGGVGLYWTGGSDDVVLSIHPIQDVTTTDPPSQIFTTQLIVYQRLQGEDTIKRMLWPPTPNPVGAPPGSLSYPTAFAALRPSQVGLKELSQINQDRLILARDVSKFSIKTASPPPLIGPPVQLSIELSRVEGGRTQTYSLQRSVHLRNSE